MKKLIWILSLMVFASAYATTSDYTLSGVVTAMDKDSITLLTDTTKTQVPRSLVGPRKLKVGSEIKVMMSKADYDQLKSTPLKAEQSKDKK